MLKYSNDAYKNLIDVFFKIHKDLDPAGDLQVEGEFRCLQCNGFFRNDVDFQTHVYSEHTYIVKDKSRNYRRTLGKNRQRLQDSLPKVQMMNKVELQNKCMAKWVGMIFAANGDVVTHIDSRIMFAKIVFGHHRRTIRSSKLSRHIKVSIYKSVALSRATFGCEYINMNSIIKRKFQTFNARCSADISGRSIAEEMSTPSFNIIAWINWKRLVWLGKVLRGDKGPMVLNALHWSYQRRVTGGCIHMFATGNDSILPSSNCICE